MSDSAREFYANFKDGDTRLSLRRAINAVGEAKIGILLVAEGDKALVPEDVMSKVAEFVAWGEKTLIPAIEKAVVAKKAAAAKKAEAKKELPALTVSEADGMTAKELTTRFASVEGVKARTTKVKVIEIATAAGLIVEDPKPKAAPKAKTEKAAPAAEVKAPKAPKAKTEKAA